MKQQKILIKGDVMINENKIKEFKKLAAQIRMETVKEIGNLGIGHIGGSLSLGEVLGVLYGGAMKIDPENPKWEERDWLVLSKGHAGPALYATLAIKGYFPMEELKTLNHPGTNLPSHCDRNRTVGIDMTTGSLGQGASTAAGVALGHKLDEKSNYVYLILGDGECNEGQVWEMALFANQFKLGNLIAFVDYNKQQLDGYTKDICDIGDVAKKFEDFGWYSQNIDGHDVEKIYEAIEKAKEQKEKPSMIVLNTVKGRGCKFTEGILSNHNMSVSKDQMDKAVCDFEEIINSL